MANRPSYLKMNGIDLTLVGIAHPCMLRDSCGGDHYSLDNG
ncbi:hypothetical protein [Lusitaniella coriacea]|nr:hypothetical protein [Lusitaniella coriacea]